MIKLTLFAVFVRSMNISRKSKCIKIKQNNNNNQLILEGLIRAMPQLIEHNQLI